MVEKILDKAGQKGTGKVSCPDLSCLVAHPVQWTAINALDLGQPVTLIAEAVNARGLRAMKEERVATAKVIPTVKHSIHRS